MNSYIVMYLSTLIEYFVNYILSLGLTSKKQPVFTKRLLVMLFMPVIVTVCSPFLSRHFVFTLFCVPLELGTLMFCLRIRLKDFIEIFIIDYILLVVFIQVPITIALSLFNITNEMSVYLLGSLLTLLVAIIVYALVPINRLYTIITRQNEITRLIVSNICLIAFFITIYFKAETSSFYDNVLIIFVTVLVLAFVYVEIIITRTHIITQNKQLEAYNSYMPIIEQLINEVRHRQHNHDNDILAISAMPTAYSTYEELASAIKDYNFHLELNNLPSSLLKLNKKLIAGFIFSKCNLALEMNKAISVSLNSYELVSNAPEYELITIIGVLIDNALDATPKEKKSS